MAKTYTTYVKLKDDNNTILTFNTLEAYQQAVSGQDIHSVIGNQEYFIPVHGICTIGGMVADDGADAPEDAYCTEE